MEEPTLNKSEYQEVTKIVKDGFDEFRIWLKDTFVCNIHCIERNNSIKEELHFKFFRVWISLLIVALIASVALGIKLLQIFGFLKGL